MYPEEGQLCLLLLLHYATVTPILPTLLSDLHGTVDETLRRYFVVRVTLQCYLLLLRAHLCRN